MIQETLNKKSKPLENNNNKIFLKIRTTIEEHFGRYMKSNRCIQMKVIDDKIQENLQESG